jgi:two-component system, NarL family, sensor kinase
MDAKATSFYTAVLIISVVLGVIIIYFIISMLRQQRRNLALYKKSILTEITTLERERSRIASDLHDEIGPMLSAVKLRINSLEPETEEDKAEIRNTSGYIDELITRLREISFDLMPNTLIRKGVVMGIREFIDYCGQQNTLNITFKHEGDIQIEEQRAINIYRIVQEVVHNTIKHAKATNLDVEIKKEKNNIVLETRDNGVGFDYGDNMANASGFGLRNLLSRTELMGGKMFVESSRNKGTAYTFEIPASNHD